MLEHWALLRQVVGWCSVLVGLLWSVHPESLRSWFIGKSWRMLFWVLLGMLSYPLGVFGKAMGWMGVAAVFAGFWLVMRIAGSAIKALFCRVPAIALRVIGLLNLFNGWLLLSK